MDPVDRPPGRTPSDSGSVNGRPGARVTTWSPRGRARRPERRRRSPHGGPGRVDVVHEYDRASHRPRGSRRRAADVRPPLRTRQPGLARDRASTREQRRRVEAPADAELAGEPFRRLVPAPERAVAVGRNVGDEVRRRPCHPRSDDVCGDGGERAETALLPRTDERPCRAQVANRRAGGSEREPPPGALPAAFDRPGGRGAAAGPERRRAARRAREQASQNGGPDCPQETQRDGKRSSKSHSWNATAEAVTCLYQLRTSALQADDVTNLRRYKMDATTLLPRQPRWRPTSSCRLITLLPTPCCYSMEPQPRCGLAPCPARTPALNRQRRETCRARVARARTGAGPAGEDALTRTPEPRSAARTSVRARRRCHPEVTTTSSPTPSASARAAIPTAFSTVERAVVSHRSSTSGPVQAARINSASPSPPRRAQPERTTARALAAKLSPCRSRFSAIG